VTTPEKDFGSAVPAGRKGGGKEGGRKKEGMKNVEEKKNKII
jgi:hypothetical protein